MPKRLGWTVLILGAGLLLSVAIIMYLAFSAGPDAPSRIESNRISSEATVSWTEEGGTTVQAGSFSDAIVLLGYGHARSRSWQMALWRQAALGRLSEWFGPDALPADRLVRRLGIPEGARSAWDGLDADTREAVTAFASGIDRAMSAPDLNRGAPFLILDIESEVWEGWHSLAVERLYAWMASAPTAADSLTRVPTWSHAQHTLEALLSFHGSQVNHAAGINHGGEPYLAARLATGSSGIPFYVESEIDYGSGRFTGLMVPGTLTAILGRTHADAWALTGSASASVTTASVSQNDMETRFHRIRHAGREEVVAAHYVGTRLLLDDPPREGVQRTVRLLSWPGAYASTDAGTWLSALAGTAPAPTLLSESGIRWSGVGFGASGSPARVLRPVADILFVTSAPDDVSPAATVAGLPEAPQWTEWMNMTLSRAASDALEPLLPLLADSLVSDQRTQEAVRYLRNWNLEYGAAEPGASILETLLASTSMPTGDDVLEGSMVRHVLEETVDELTLRYGPDMSSWRWETVQERAVTFPGATGSVADGGRPEERFADKYQPVTIRAPGHPQSLVWGSPPSTDSLRITSAWEGVLDLREGLLHYRRPVVDFNRFLGTFLTGDRPPDIETLRRASQDASTTFIPRR